MVQSAMDSIASECPQSLHGDYTCANDSGNGIGILKWPFQSSVERELHSAIRTASSMGPLFAPSVFKNLMKAYQFMFV